MTSTQSVWPELEADVGADPTYRDLMIAEAGSAFLEGEFEVARGLLRTVVRGAFGYDSVAAAASLPRARLVRALRRSEPASAATVRVVLTAVSRLAGIRLQVEPARLEEAAQAAE